MHGMASTGRSSLHLTRIFPGQVREILSKRIKDSPTLQKPVASSSKIPPAEKTRPLSQKDIVINGKVANTKTTELLVPKVREKAPMKEVNQTPASSTSSSSLHQKIDLTNFPFPPLKHINFAPQADVDVLREFGGDGSSGSLLNDKIEIEQLLKK